MAEGVSPVARREVLWVAGWRIFRVVWRNREELWFDRVWKKDRIGEIFFYESVKEKRRVQKIRKNKRGKDGKEL